MEGIISSGLRVTTILSYVLSLCVLAALSCVASFFITIELRKRKLKHIPGPKRTSAIYGCLQEIREFLESGKNKMELFMKWQEEYGAVFKYSVLHRYITTALDPVVVKEILTKTSIHSKPHRPYGIMGKVLGTRFMGNGLLTESNHVRWKVHRAMLNPSFHRKSLMTMIERFNTSADHLLNYLKTKADGLQEVRMNDAFNNITLDIIAKITFDLDLNVIDDPDSPFPTAIMTCLNAIMNSIHDPWLQYGLTTKARQTKADVKEACDMLRRVGRDCVKNRLAAKARGEELPVDMLTSILEASQDLKGDENFGMDEMLDEFVTFFIAGQETTSNLMSFTLELLGKHPDVLQKVQDELDEKLGNKMFISFQDMNRLEYLTLVLKESLRIYPPAATFTRLSGTDVTTSSGLVIPKGTTVNLSPFIMGRMPEYFEDPLVFRPERFIESKHSAYTYFPFGLGERGCIGQQFAFIEARIIMAKILQQFKFDLVPGQDWNISFAVTLRPVDGCKNYVSFRK